MTFEEILFLIGFMAIVVIGLIIPCFLVSCQAGTERKSNKERQQYIDSIKPGDVFDWDNREDRRYKNPFDESDDALVNLRTTVIDIKTNEAGVKWVKYYYTLSGPGGMWFTDKLEDYLKQRYRIQKAD